jgi:hypothetical protein
MNTYSISLYLLGYLASLVPISRKMFDIIKDDPGEKDNLKLIATAFGLVLGLVWPIWSTV